MAQLIKTNGDVSTVLPKNGKYFSLKEMQEYVGGYIEVVRFTGGKEVMIVDEEGKVKGKELNRAAMICASVCRGIVTEIAGDVLQGTRKEFKV
jgi:Domain of unknown function (DUF3846)